MFEFFYGLSLQAWDAINVSLFVLFKDHYLIYSGSTTEKRGWRDL